MLAPLAAAITGQISGHPHWAYGAVFLLALSESIPVIGAVVPGSAIIIAISALIPKGVVSLLPVMVAAIAGAVAGDGVSFWLGHRYQRQALQVWPLDRVPELVSRSERFFARHGDKSVFIARFTPGVRAFVPLMAGILRMQTRRFYVSNILSALVWAPTHIFPGVLIGASFGYIGAAAEPLAIMLIVLIAFVWTMAHLIRAALRRGVPAALAMFDRIRGWAQLHDTATGRVLRALLDPDRNEARAVAVLAAILLATAWLFFGILEDVVNRDPLVTADVGIFHMLQTLRSPIGDYVMIAVTELGDTKVVLPVTISVFAWLAWKGAWRTAIYWIVAVFGASALNSIIKAALHRARPGSLGYFGWSEYSFPSGHSTVNIVLYSFFAFLVARSLKRKWFAPTVLVAAIFVSLIAFSRLYLGAHWFSDVIGGMAFGLLWLSALGFFYLRRDAEHLEPGGLAIIGVLALGTFGCINVYRHHAADYTRYAVHENEPVVSASSWWARDWASIASRRTDITGEVEEPLCLQWQGDLQTLRTVLAPSGWRPAKPWTFSSSLAWLGETDPVTVPVLPSFHMGRMPDMTLVKASHRAGSKNGRLVLRLWKVDVQMTGSASGELWIGSVVDERIEHFVSGIPWVVVSPDAAETRNAIARALPDAKIVMRREEAAIDHRDLKVVLGREASGH